MNKNFSNNGAANNNNNSNVRCNCRYEFDACKRTNIFWADRKILVHQTAGRHPPFLLYKDISRGINEGIEYFYRWIRRLGRIWKTLSLLYCYNGNARPKLRYWERSKAFGRAFTLYWMWELVHSCRPDYQRRAPI